MVPKFNPLKKSLAHNSVVQTISICSSGFARLTQVSESLVWWVAGSRLSFLTWHHSLQQTRMGSFTRYQAQPRGEHFPAYITFAIVSLETTSSAIFKEIETESEGFSTQSVLGMMQWVMSGNKGHTALFRRRAWWRWSWEITRWWREFWWNWRNHSPEQSAWTS